MIDSINIAFVSADGIYIGTNKWKLLKIILIPPLKVMHIISCESAVLNVMWNSKLLVVSSNFLQNPNLFSSGRCSLILPLLASIS